MLIKLLLFVKHNFGFLWLLIERVNSGLFILLHEKRVRKELQSTMDNQEGSYSTRLLSKNDLEIVKQLIGSQNPNRLTYFRPHGFDKKSIQRALVSRSLITMGVFQEKTLVGYFFLRCFWNRKCFVGRLVDEKWEGKGIGKIMNDVMYNTAWNSGFRCLSTISRKNAFVMNAHAKNQSMIILKELPNDYLFVEFLKKAQLEQNQP